MAKKKKQVKEEVSKEMVKVGFKPNEKPKTAEQIEIERLLSLGKVKK